MSKNEDIYEMLLLHKIPTSASFDFVDHNKLLIILRNGNTRSPYVPPEKPLCGSRSNS